VSPAGDEEESIEEYMAKLMQRLRGDGTPDPAASYAPAVGSKSHPAIEAGSQGPLPPVNTGALPSTYSFADPQDGEQATVPAEFKPSGPAPERPADLQMFRELANASARSAIAVHSSKVHRRSAFTKVIVSTLAAMTSLWLMLQAPDWRDMQFVFACVLLCVAAYWAGQTIQMLIESSRASKYDGPEYDGDLQYGPLPIDVDRERW
jgi:hypothetical protein